MKPPLPTWALTLAGPQDRLAALRAQDRDVMQIRWKNGLPSRDWAKQHGWPAPWFGFEKALVDRMFSHQESFELALTAGGAEISIPKESHDIGSEELGEMDEAYRGHSWRWLVDALREIRRAVEAGVAVHVDGATLTSFESFYSWAHGRYHALEDDGGTAWIGDDSPHPYG